MRDVIIVGAGAGGPVVAAELASRGLDVLLLEAGAHATRPGDVWSHFEDDANNPLTGYFRFGPAERSERAWFRELPQNSFVWQSAGVGGTTLHYYGNCPRPYPGAFAGYDRPDKNAYDTAHLFPFTYRELVPYLERLEAVLPVQTAAMGTKEVVFFSGAEKLGIPLQKTKDTVGFAYRPQENAILQPGGNAGLTTDSAKLRYPHATGCTMCGHCFQGCVQPIGAPRNLLAKRSTANSYVPMALTADAWSAHGRAITLIPDAYAVRVHTERSGGEPVATGVTWRLTRTSRAGARRTRGCGSIADCPTRTTGWGAAAPTTTSTLWSGSSTATRRRPKDRAPRPAATSRAMAGSNLSDCPPAFRDLP
jgi:choline dehydrogenase-like flavoprotein